MLSAFTDETPLSSLLRRSSRFGYEGRKLRGNRRRRINGPESSFAACPNNSTFTIHHSQFRFTYQSQTQNPELRTQNFPALTPLPLYPFTPPRLPPFPRPLAFEARRERSRLCSDIPLDGKFLGMAAGLCHIVCKLHPKKMVHVGTERFLNAEGHFRG